VEHFYVGLNNPSFAWAFSHSMLSINELRRRKRDFRVNRWILDSGAFTEISTHGRWRHDSDEYIELIHRWSTVGQLDAAVSQDMMCEPDILAKTGLSIAEHQENTIIRYNEISQWVDVYVMPVLQGYSPASYADHVRQYGKLLKHGQWVGVGSVCKRNGNPDAIEDVLLAIKRERPDLRCTGSASKHQRLNDLPVRALLHSSDSMAWSLAGRKQRRNAHDPRRAVAYVDHMHAILKQPGFVQAQFHQLTTTNNET